MSEVFVDGYSAQSPVADEDWADEVRWQVNQQWPADRGLHNANGWFADEAGSDKCRALGHTEADFENEDTHPYGWDMEPLCYATKHGVACPECESDDCPVLNRITGMPRLWELVAA